MTETENPDPRTVNFSQANGYEELPQPLALGEVSYDARRKLWDLLWNSAWYQWDNSSQLRLADAWLEVFKTSHSDFLGLPADEFHTDPYALRNSYKNMILANLPFNRLFDLFQLFLRHDYCPFDFGESTASVFLDCRLAYVVDTNGPPTILPAATPQEGETLTAALRQLKESGYSGAEAHLREAGVQINDGEWAESVRESIHAVESVAQQLDPRGSKSFVDAMNALENRVRIHPALSKAFGGLYGYTSDEQGIRHALLDEPESPVGQDEAVFMLGACASFVTYLLSKSRGQTNP